MNFIIDQNYLFASKLNDMKTRTDLKFLSWYKVFLTLKIVLGFIEEKGYGHDLKVILRSSWNLRES